MLDLLMHVLLRVLFFFGPQPLAAILGPRPQPRALLTFLRPPVQITCSRPLTRELLFHGPPA